ncbi:glycosyltransferase family 2 protein [Rubripirellula reticaptiva]|uniref:Glycosyl transferase family 2 n=1 Tax=Rubripirellula reticaptiva TaxID=2528013 RepID=A0A5C6EPD2_9BACT|nr:glycosyltransferase family 2 protein [Rubripirellula reticaptiva]TWU49476.1 hypothetical protein Poly59_40910 [Rubripirellula reticaptiva]
MNRPKLSSVAVLGSYRGGTSVVTGLLKHFGFFVGDAFFNAWNGYWTYEDVYLRRLCLECFDEREGNWSHRADFATRVERLSRWSEWARWRAVEEDACGIAGKHPTLCKLVPELTDAWTSDGGSAAKLVSVSRDAESIISAWRKSKSPNGHPWWPRGDVEDIVHDLIRCRDSSLEGVEHLVFDYERLRREPEFEIGRLADYCEVGDIRKSIAIDWYTDTCRALGQGTPLVLGWEHSANPESGKPPTELPELQNAMSNAFVDLQVSRRLPSLPLDKVLCVMITFNERLRLPDTLRHYRSLGVDRFAIIDNGSDDGTVELLLSQHDCDVYFMPHAYRSSVGGSGWSSTLIREFYGTGRWVVCTDADEQMVYHDCERHDLHDLVRLLKDSGQSSLPCVTIDCYSDRGFLTSVLDPNQQMVDCCPLFDSEGYVRLELNDPADGVPRVIWSGGPIEREMNAPCGWLAKVPLMYWKAETWNWNPHVAYPFERNFSAPSGAILHFKWLSDLSGVVGREIARNQRTYNAEKYRLLGRKIATQGDISLVSFRSRKYEGSSSIVGAGFADVVDWNNEQERIIPKLPSS